MRRFLSSPLEWIVAYPLEQAIQAAIRFENARGALRRERMDLRVEELEEQVRDLRTIVEVFGQAATAESIVRRAVNGDQPAGNVVPFQSRGG